MNERGTLGAIWLGADGSITAVTKTEQQGQQLDVAN